jgi:hypothetical protein
LKKSRKTASKLPILGLFYLIVVLGAAGCAPLTPTPSPEALPPAEGLVQTLRQQQDQVRSFAGRGRLRLKTRRSQYHFEVMLAAVKPSQLLLQAFDPMGRPALTMTANTEEIVLLDYQAERFYRGEASAENFDRLLPLGVGVSDLINLMSGGQVLGEYGKVSVEPAGSGEEPLWRLSLIRPGGARVERLWLRPPGLLVAMAEMGPTVGDPEYRLGFEDYRQFEGGTAPFEIHLSALADGTDLTINYKEIKINPELPDKIFQLTPPAGLAVEPIPGPGDEAL